ncbi:MAG: hypothetical protein C5B48_04850 [Candidatus Rokuibacteriota bacterium]|nr:MAG: hypothetical protein C5B48_04850 [Candidatus Rokubacteria bacterium]
MMATLPTISLAEAEVPARSGVRMAALGGGTGLSVLLRGLKAALLPAGSGWGGESDGGQLTAIVTAADDGGSSGRLRQAYGVLPPGDVRNCLLALSDASPTLTGLFDFRFNGHIESGVNGHSLGNLILTALHHLERDHLRAMELAHELLAVRGKVLPATLDDVRLCAEFVDGTRIEGESRIAAVRQSIRRVYLVPETARALPEACGAIAAADLVLLGPGSLYTSVLPVLLMREVGDAITRSHARVVLVMNLMTEPGETDGYGAPDFVRAIRRHVPDVPIDDVLLNITPIPEEAARRYAALGARPIDPERDALEALGCRPVDRDLLGCGPLIRHDPDKLGQAVLDLTLRTIPRLGECHARPSRTAD